jgi:hypothetical protein
MSISVRGIVFLAAFLAVANGQGCSICGDGKSVTKPDAIFEFPGYSPAPCGELQTVGQNGGVPLENCPQLPLLIGVCACAPSPTVETASPVLKTTRPPSKKPIATRPTTRKPTTRKPTTRKPTTRRPPTKKPAL